MMESELVIHIMNSFCDNVVHVSVMYCKIESTNDTFASNNDTYAIINKSAQVRLGICGLIYTAQPSRKRDVFAFKNTESKYLKIYVCILNFVRTL